MGGQVIESGTPKRRRRRGAKRPMSEINVVPFVDVMLVLLVIFMVAAPLLTVGVPVELPRSAAAALPAEREEPLTIALASDGRILVQNAEVERERLVPMLRAVAAERATDRVYLRADGAITYEGVMQVMGALNASGFRSIGLVTDEGGPRLDGRDD